MHEIIVQEGSLQKYCKKPQSIAAGKPSNLKEKAPVFKTSYSRN
jgi:hypothetical protein